MTRQSVAPRRTERPPVAARRPLCGALLGLLLWAGLAHALSPAERMEFADGLYTRGLYDLALDEYLPLTRDPGDLEALDRVWFRVAECYRRLGQPEASDRFYLRLTREHPDSDYRDRAEFRRAEVRFTLGRLAEALDLLRELLERDLPDALAASAWYYRGYAARELDRPAEAETAFRTVVDRFPDAPVASFAALELAALLRDRPEESDVVPALYAQVLATPATPGAEAEALFQRADWWFRLGDYPAAVADYDRLRQRHAGSDRERDAGMQAAWAFHNTGRHADAAALAEQALADPERAAGQETEWLYVLANAQRQLLRTADAQATYARLIERDPEHELARIAGYESLLISFRRDQFEEVIERSGLLEADGAVRSDMYWLLAESYAAIGRDDEAVQYYRMLLAEEPDGARAPEVLYRLGRILQQRREHVAAIRLFRRLADDFAGHELAPRALYAAALALAMEGRYEEALEGWTRLLADHPAAEPVEDTRYQLALAHMELGAADRAREAFGNYIAQHPAAGRVTDAYYWLGVLEADEGAYEASEQALREVLARSPAGELRERAQFILAANLYRLDRAAEAADLVQALMATGTGSELPLSLVEWLAVYRLDTNDPAAAVPAAEWLIARGAEPAWQQIGWYLAGRARRAQEDEPAAVEAFTRSLEQTAQTREGGEAAWHLGVLALAAGDPAEAAVRFEEAAGYAAAGDWAELRARSYFGLGQAAEAAEDWAQAARYFLSVGILFDDPEMIPEALYRGAEALGRQDRGAERDRTLEELRERFPESEWTRKVIDD